MTNNDAPALRDGALSMIHPGWYCRIKHIFVGISTETKLINIKEQTMSRTSDMLAFPHSETLRPRLVLFLTLGRRSLTQMPESFLERMRPLRVPCADLPRPIYPSSFQLLASATVYSQGKGLYFQTQLQSLTTRRLLTFCVEYEVCYLLWAAKMLRPRTYGTRWKC